MGAVKPPLRAKSEDDGVTLLSPMRDLVEITGPMTYNESAQAWNIIRLRKDILHEFPDLKDKRTLFNYKLIIPRNPQAIKKLMEESSKSQNVLPIFLSFSKVKKEEQ
jgi:hypothetical protein